MTVVSNPGGYPANASVPNYTNFTASGGTYYLTALTVGSNCNISFSGKATLYVDGNVSMTDNNTFTAYQNDPANLVIYQSAGHTFTANNSNTVVAVYYGPGCNVTFAQNATFRGALLAKNFTVNDNADLFYDESLATNTSSATIGMGK